MTTISDRDHAEAQAMAEAFKNCAAFTSLPDYAVRRWLAVRDHVLAAHECPPVPVWRPTIRDEIQPGWEVRSRARAGYEAVWGVAHHQDSDGEWLTEAGNRLTWDGMGWTYETTADRAAITKGEQS